VIAEGMEGRVAEQDDEPVAKDQKKAKKRDMESEPDLDTAEAAVAESVEAADGDNADAPVESSAPQTDEVAGDTPRDSS